MFIIRTPNTEKEWEDYYDLRYRILRLPLGQPLGSERNEGDSTGKHFALYLNGQLNAIARLDQPEKYTSQVRFVAVESNTQGKGFGKEIMTAVENFSKKSGNRKMILQARENALDFYLKLDYKLIEKSYLLFGQVQHYLMKKEY